MADTEKEVDQAHEDDPDYKLPAELREIDTATFQSLLSRAAQEKLQMLIGRSSGYIESLPKPVRKRINKLSSLQEEHDTLEAKYLEEKAELEKKYEALYAPLYNQRSLIVQGKMDAEIEAEPEEEEEEGGDGEQKKEAEKGEEAKEESAEQEPIVGIPEFWLCALRNGTATGDMITEQDEKILKHLIDIRCQRLEGGKKDKGEGEEDKGEGEEDEDEDEDVEDEGFKLIFEFEENEYLANKELHKIYVMGDDDTMGLTLERAEGCEIDWKSGKNPCVKILKKKSKKTGKTMTKEEPQESFFNFFSPPEIEEEPDDEEEAERLWVALEEDYGIGVFIKEKIVPHAIDWYTGSAIDNEIDDDDEDDDDDDDDEDDDEDNDDKPAKGASKGKSAAAKQTGSKEENPECKQQ